MVPMLAVSSIEKKLEMQASVIVGNYEFYYAVGKFSALTSLGADENTRPVELKEAVENALADFQPADDVQAYLVRLLERYRPSESYDAQMNLLFRWGREGKEPV